MIFLEIKVTALVSHQSRINLNPQHKINKNQPHKKYKHNKKNENNNEITKNPRLLHLTQEE